MISKTVAALLSYRIKSCKKKLAAELLFHGKFRMADRKPPLNYLSIFFCYFCNAVMKYLVYQVFFLSSLSPVLNTFQPFMVSNIVCYFIKMSIPSIN